jgi:hypothetical protein
MHPAAPKKQTEESDGNKARANLGDDLEAQFR